MPDEKLELAGMESDDLFSEFDKESQAGELSEDSDFRGKAIEFQREKIFIIIVCNEQNYKLLI